MRWGRQGTLAMVWATAFVLALSGCGRDGAPAAHRARLPKPVAERLAGSSEQLATLIESGDTCGAATQADTLQHDAAAAIAARRVPPAFRRQLTAATAQLADQVNCVAVPVQLEQAPADKHKAKKPPGHLKKHFAPKAPKQPKPEPQSQSDGGGGAGPEPQTQSQSDGASNPAP
ncbi:MAG: hypothetical protein QOG09_820 [Solirubrobacterales bacterium]|jgi:hypothetical protein|nr:hypothetical protein [Solirubrobacterales bacterium]MDX6662718.1 hypothetical protein [Solirubrobacterales bacterium]